jgi:hypothetical protein
MVMKFFIICISIVSGVFAIVVYAKAIKHRIKEFNDKLGIKK